jgi:hypothetical protein
VANLLQARCHLLSILLLAAVVEVAQDLLAVAAVEDI